MSELPEWVTTLPVNECDCSGCPYAIAMHDALSIAWQALSFYSIAQETGITIRTKGQTAVDAIRRIEELGK